MKKNNYLKKPVVIAVSGGFDPVHVGHVRMFNEARKLGDKLVVILNNDHWLAKKKGYVFMNELERKEIILSFKSVDEVVITKHPVNPQDMSVSAELARLKPDIMANGGDRNVKNAHDKNSSLYKDMTTCQKYGIRMVYNVGHGGKVQSSSELVDRAVKTAPRKIAVKIKK